jgi:hypothetical protein
MIDDKEGTFVEIQEKALTSFFAEYDPIISRYVVEAVVMYHCIDPTVLAAIEEAKQPIALEHNYMIIRFLSETASVLVMTKNLKRGEHSTVRIWPSGWLVGENNINITDVVGLKIVGLEYSSSLTINLYV